MFRGQLPKMQPKISRDMAKHNMRELKQMHAMLQLLHNYGEAEQHEKCQNIQQHGAVRSDVSLVVTACTYSQIRYLLLALVAGQARKSERMICTEKVIDKLPRLGRSAVGIGRIELHESDWIMQP